MRAGGTQLSGNETQSIKFRPKDTFKLGRFHGNVETFPPTFVVPFRYSKIMSSTVSAAAANVQAFQLNSLSSPQATAGGTQPQWFTQLCNANLSGAPYSEYTVTKARVRVTIECTDPSNSGVYCYAEVYSGASGISTVANPIDYLQVPNLHLMRAGPAGGANSFQTVEFDVDIAGFLGFENALSAGQLKAAYNANPAQGVYLDVGVRAIAGVASSSYVCTVEILQEAVLTDENDEADD